MPQRLLFADAMVEPKRKAQTPGKPPCRLCGAVPPKPRSVMPLTHALETVQGILIDRLDSMTDDIARIIGDEVTDLLDVPPPVLARIAGRVIDGLNYRFFPEAYEDGEPYTPDPAGRMALPVNPVGLIPPRPTIAILARHLIEKGKASPANASLPGLFTDAELERLGQRIERREGRG